MPAVFIFAEQVQQIVRSGKREMDIPQGTRISSAAADLIKAHGIIVKTVASGKAQAAGIAKADTASDDADHTAMDGSSVTPPTDNSEERQPIETPPELSEEELEEIVNRVVARVKQLKSTGPVKTISGKATEKASEPEEAADADDFVICRCEEITRSEIKAAIRNGIHTLNGIKRVTRAGMGLCQGQTCQQLIARILAQELGVSVADIDPTTARGPVRPLRLAVFANS